MERRTCDQADQFTGVQTERWIIGQISGHTDGQNDRRTDGQKDRRTDERTDMKTFRQTARQTEGTVRQTGRQKESETDRYSRTDADDIQTYRWSKCKRMDGNGQSNERMNGRTK